MTSSLYQRIYAVVRQIPAGAVSTYGQIGQLAGCNARTVGFALAALPPGSDVPWQRVINRQGKVSPRRDGDRGLLQQDLLKAEGVEFARDGRVELGKYGHRFLARD